MDKGSFCKLYSSRKKKILIHYQLVTGSRLYHGKVLSIILPYMLLAVEATTEKVLS